VFSKALSKAPADRYDSCKEFATALGQRLGTVAAESGASDATMSARVASGPKHRSRPGQPVEKSTRRRPATLIAAVAVLLLVGGAAGAWVLFGRGHHPSAAPPTSGREQGTQTAAPGSPVVPVVLIGADCATLGAAGVSAKGAQAYCSRLQTTGDTVWSLYSGQVPTPSETPGPTDEVYPPDIEQQVRVCMEETHRTRLECREDIRRGNITGPA
jgi:serine/threonine protein kinase, bacterial